MEALQWIFTVCAVAGGALFVIRLILQFVGVFDESDLEGGDMEDGGSDPGEEGLGDSDVSFRYLSLQGLTAFFMMFGLGGRALLESRVGAVWAVAGAVVIGLFSVWVIARIFKLMGKLQSSGTLNLKTAIGQKATVYLTIPAGGTGKISLTIQEGLKVMDAVAEDKAEIRTDEVVEVTGLTTDNLFIVRKAGS